MTTGEIIRKLLEERKRVILPGFGNMEIRESGDTFPTRAKKIDPPGLSVKFDGTYSKDDGLLAAALAEEEQIDPEEARQRVLELVDAIKFALDKGEPYVIEGAGTLTRDDDGKVHFRTDPGWVLEPDQYGLESLDLLELEDLPEEKEAEAEATAKEEVEEETEKEPAGEEAAVKESAEAKETEAEAAEEETEAEAAEEEIEEKTEKEPAGEEAAPTEQAEKEPAEEPASQEPVMQKEPVDHQPPKPPPTPYEPWKKEKPRRRISNTWRVIWILATVLIVILVVLIFVPAESFHIFGLRDKAPAETYQEQLDDTGPAEPGSGETAVPGETMDEGTGEPAREEPGIPAEQVTEPPAEEALETPNFYIIAGSFRHLGYASELQDKMKGRGYQAEIMMTENRMYRVSVASFVTREEAERALAGIKSDPGMEACWLLSN